MDVDVVPEVPLRDVVCDLDQLGHPGRRERRAGKSVPGRRAVPPSRSRSRAGGEPSAGRGEVQPGKPWICSTNTTPSLDARGRRADRSSSSRFRHQATRAAPKPPAAPTPSSRARFRRASGRQRAPGRRSVGGATHAEAQKIASAELGSDEERQPAGSSGRGRSRGDRRHRLQPRVRAARSRVRPRY